MECAKNQDFSTPFIGTMKNSRSYALRKTHKFRRGLGGLFDQLLGDVNAQVQISHTVDTKSIVMLTGGAIAAGLIIKKIKI